MSWWIVDFKSINENGTEGLCDIECDTAASLPAADQTLTAGIKIVRGSKALDLSTGDRYKMNSSGSWVQQPSEYSLDLTGYATEQYVDSGLAAKVDTTTYTAGQDAQDAVIADKWGYIRSTIGGSGDFNTAVSSGYYRYNGAPANAPTGANGEFGVLMVYAAGSYISQIAHCFLSTRYGLYIRSSTNTGGTWTAWTQI